MSKPARLLPAAFAVALACSICAGPASGQAMISYGHGVAKAAGAGAAVGGGIGGILTGLGNPLSTAAGQRGTPTQRSAAGERQTVPARRGPVTWDVPQRGFGSPAPLPLVGGVQANGEINADWQPTLLAPSQNLAVISAIWGGPSVTAQEDSAEVAPAEERLVEDQAETATALTQNLPIVARSSKQSSAAGASGATARSATTPAALPEGVAVGTSMEELLKKLGRPYLSFRGVAGEGYTDQYVFELPDGGHLVVYVLDGMVAHLALG